MDGQRLIARVVYSPQPGSYLKDPNYYRWEPKPRYVLSVIAARVPGECYKDWELSTVVYSDSRRALRLIQRGVQRQLNQGQLTLDQIEAQTCAQHSHNPLLLFLP